jgi:hypothetical protein
MKRVQQKLHNYSVLPALVKLQYFRYAESKYFYMTGYIVLFNPLPALTYPNVLDLNVACWAKRIQTYWHLRKFKCPLKKRSLPAHAVGI